LAFFDINPVSFGHSLVIPKCKRVLFLTPIESLKLIFLLLFQWYKTMVQSCTNYPTCECIPIILCSTFYLSLELSDCVWLILTCDVSALSKLNSHKTYSVLFTIFYP
jgi:hypothetical protein